MTIRVAWVLLETLLFLAVVVGAVVWLWRFVRQYRVTALICPVCGTQTPLSPSKPDIRCRQCRRVLRQGGQLAEDVAVQSVRVF
ncbi:MAG TPA: hypothetical protein VIL95_08730 [Bacillota bacterium]